ncbi:hypothetical protein MY8738_003063 [Beauveria namnaoensis]
MPPNFPGPPDSKIKMTPAPTLENLATPQETPCHGGSGKPAKRKPVRRDAERRRQQNIQAQRKYRTWLRHPLHSPSYPKFSTADPLRLGEKRKARLDDLETLAASLSESVGVSMLYRSGPSSSPIAPFNVAGDAQLGFYRNDEQGLNGAAANGSPADALDVYPSTSISPDAALDGCTWDLNASIDPSNIHYNGGPSPSPPNWPGFVDCGCLCPHVQVTSSRPRAYLELDADTVSHSSRSVDLYAHTLRVERICIVEAMASLCLHIGITKDMMCVDKAASPFFRPTGEITNGTRADAVVKTVQTIFKSLKPDMRPIREQIIYQHAAFIDVLPFPTLRRNVINSGEAINLTEFYHDLIDGLVCWGGTADQRSTADSATGDASTGTPWESRSWEARTWFLRKYFTLLGGDEGELVRQSEWWRNVRGDDTDLWLEV